MSRIGRFSWISSTACMLACLGVTAAWAQACYKAQTPPPLTPEQLRTLVITDQAVLNRPEFSFGATLGAIIKTAAPGKIEDSAAERIALLTTMIRSFRITDRVNPDSGLNLRVTPRPNEAALDPIKLLGSGPGRMKPIALFNRWDLVPEDYRHCGEHRIVFARETDPADTPPNRFLLIFEAAVDNPHPTNDKSGCEGIVSFWKSLEGKPAAVLADNLIKFYFQGLESNKAGLPNYQPAIHAQHFGAPYGQVRGNVFMTQGQPALHKWQLREWRVSLSAEGAPVFSVDTVKKNPHTKLYDDLSNAEIEGGFDLLRQSFGVEFLASYLGELTEIDQKSNPKPISGHDLIATVGANFHGRFDTFTSVSQDRDDDPEAIANAAAQLTFKTKLTEELKKIPLAAACGLTADHILARAGTVSCGGCHRFSADREIAPGIVWPKPVVVPTPQGERLDFVHVSENGDLSPALRDHLLPARREILMSVFPPAVAEAAPAAPSVAMAAEARDALARVRASENRLDAIEALRDFESRVRTLRQIESQKAGAFVRNRRVH